MKYPICWFCWPKTLKPKKSIAYLIKSEEEAKKEILKRFNDPSYTKVLNVRHPLSRLVSAWGDKFKRTKDEISFWMKNYGNFINEKFGKGTYPIPEDYLVSLEAFLDYVAWVGRDEEFEFHWKSFDYYCRPCSLRFDYITKYMVKNVRTNLLTPKLSDEVRDSKRL